MRSYTWGSAEGVQNAIDALPERFPMDLRPDDMEALIRALSYTVDTLVCADHFERINPNDHDAGMGCGDECWVGRAGGLLSVIAEALGSDWI